MISLHTIKTLFVFLIVIGFGSCSMMYTGGFDTCFWTSTPGENVSLFINGEDKGKLPYIATGPDCDNGEAKRLSLMVYLPSDTYEIQVRDEHKKILYTETFTARKRGNDITISTSTDDKKGGSRVIMEDKCLRHEIFYTRR